MPEGQKAPPSSNPGIAARVVPPFVLAALTLVTRVFFHGELYFADGPQQVKWALSKVERAG